MGPLAIGFQSTSYLSFRPPTIVYVYSLDSAIISYPSAPLPSRMRVGPVHALFTLYLWHLVQCLTYDGNNNNNNNIMMVIVDKDRKSYKKF